MGSRPPRDLRRGATTAAILTFTLSRGGEGQGSYRAPRTPGKPDLNGIWQALGTAHWDGVASGQGFYSYPNAAFAQPGFL